MSSLVDYTSENELDALESEYNAQLNELKALFPKHAFHTNPNENKGSYNEQFYNDLITNLDSKKGLLTTAITTLEQELETITGVVKGIKENDNSVTKKDELTPKQMISDKVDIYNFHKLNIFIRVIGIAGLLFLFKLKFKGNIKNPLASSNSMSSNSMSSNSKSSNSK
tara:strand:- start:350 stop:853 length:504 start_codon:yes stop_codon:yes gene_type:complete